MRRATSASLFLALLLLGARLAPTGPSPQADYYEPFGSTSQQTHPGLVGRRGPNILLIRIDDAGRCQLDGTCGDAISTPNLDNLATIGQRYENFYTPSICGPSTADLITGEMDAAGVATSQITTSDVHLGEVLRRAGYTKRDWIGKLSVYVGGSYTQESAAEAWVAAGGTSYTGPPGAAPLADDCSSSLTDWGHWCQCETTSASSATCQANSTFEWQWVVDTAIANIQATPPGVQAFWGVGLGAIHTPAFDPSAGAPYTASTCGGSNDYDCLPAMNAELDDEIGQLIAAVDLTTTVVCAYSDNGPWSTDPADYLSANVGTGGAKGKINDEGTRTVMWCAGAGVPHVATPGDHIHVADLWATLPALAGFDVRSLTLDDAGNPIRYQQSESFADRLLGRCNSDDCAFTDRRWIVSASEGPGTEYGIWDRSNPTCKLTVPEASLGDVSTADVWDLPDEITPSASGTCYTERMRLQTQLRSMYYDRQSFVGPTDTFGENFELAVDDCTQLQILGYAGGATTGCAATSPTPPEGTHAMVLGADNGSYMHAEGACWSGTCRLEFEMEFAALPFATHADPIALWTNGGGAYVCGLRYDQGAQTLSLSTTGTTSGNVVVFTPTPGTFYHYILEANGTADTCRVWVDPSGGSATPGQTAYAANDAAIGQPGGIWWQRDTLAAPAFDVITAENGATDTAPVP